MFSPRSPSTIAYNSALEDSACHCLSHLSDLSDRIFAVATFDSNGILEHSEFREDRRAAHWTEAVFSAIGFKGLLDAALEHSSFRHAKISSDRHVAFLIRRRQRYIALLSEPLDSWEQEAQMRRYLWEMGTGDLLDLMRHPIGQARVNQAQLGQAQMAS